MNSFKLRKIFFLLNIGKIKLISLCVSKQETSKKRVSKQCYTLSVVRFVTLNVLWTQGQIRSRFFFSGKTIAVQGIR